jgi:enoyl-CoA hydratase/carnithine racemase
MSKMKNGMAQRSDTDEVQLVVKADALRIRLNRPDAMNALTPRIVSEVTGLLRANVNNPVIKAVVLTGAGASFCAGADLKVVRGQTAENAGTLAEFLASVSTLMAELEAFPRPVIAAVNGLAVAGGLELVLCCDLVVAARSARFGDAHANYGLLPGGGASVRLPRKIGVTRAKYLFYTGDFLPAEDLLAAGLVNQVVDDSELEAATDQIVGKLARKSSLGLSRMKALVDDGMEQPKNVALRAELLASEVHAHSFDMKEGLAAFEEKRSPQFLGR